MFVKVFLGFGIDCVDFAERYMMCKGFPTAFLAYPVVMLLDSWTGVCFWLCACLLGGLVLHLGIIVAIAVCNIYVCIQDMQFC